MIQRGIQGLPCEPKRSEKSKFVEYYKYVLLLKLQRGEKKKETHGEIADIWD